MSPWRLCQVLGLKAGAPPRDLKTFISSGEHSQRVCGPKRLLIGLNRSSRRERGALQRPRRRDERKDSYLLLGSRAKMAASLNAPTTPGADYT